ncbi:MAG: lytic transglycosylase domain-containing protein, partial [Deltaproteobacteria bacterium]|nr:lytic transglycosylase domain-containing protein [Deltaproteobacteria bacterium]
MDANSRLKPSINYFSRFIVPLGPLLIALILLAEGSLNITGYIRGQYGEDELFDLPVGISRAEGEEPAQASQPPARQLRPLELYRTETVHDMIRFLLEKRPDIITQGFQRSGRYLPMIRSIFRQEGLPLELSYLAAVESNFHPLARSSQNAMGLWQLMSSTARRFGLTVNAPWYDERLDPELSTRAAARLLKYLHDKYGSWELALAAYNAGEGRVNRAIRTARANGMATDYWSLPLPRETRGFVPTFLAMAEIHGNPEMYGLTGHLVEKPLEYGT